MDIEIVLEPDIPPARVVEIAVAAENYGIRALWTSNFWAHWDGFISLSIFLYLISPPALFTNP